MTKQQRDERAKQLATKAAVLSKVDGLDRNYNFDEEHSINPTDGRTNDGTALTKTNNISLGETAYDVMQQSDELDLEDVLHDPYHDDEEDNSKLNLEMNEVHRNMGRRTRKTGPSCQTRGDQPLRVRHSRNQDTATKTTGQPLVVAVTSQET